MICSLFETLSAQLLSSSCPNAASLVTITRNSTNTHTYCGTRGAKFHLSHVGVGKCFLVLHVQYAKFLAFSRLISRTMASCFPGASTSIMCPMFGRCIRSFSCLVWRLLQSSDTFRSRAECSPFVLRVLGIIVGTLVCLCFPVTAFRLSSSVYTGTLFGSTSPPNSVEVSFDHL